MAITNDLELMSSILNGLRINCEKYGKRYCPCSVVRNDDTVCRCKEYRETGICHCGLYVK